MTTNRVFPSGLALLAAAMLFAAGAAQAQTRPKVSLTMGGDGLQFITQHIAMRGGFFAEEGLDAETVDVGSGPRQVAALMGGSSDFSSLGLIQVIKSNAQGGDLVAVSTEFDILDIQIVASAEAVKKAGIVAGMSIDDRVKRLAGLRFGVTSPGSTTDTFLRSLFQSRGMAPDSTIKIQPTGGGSNMLAAMEKGASDGFAWGAPQSLMAEASGVGKIVVSPFDGDVPEVNNVPYLVIATSRETLKKKPEVILAGVRAMAKAMKLAKEQPEKAKQLVRAQFPNIPDAIFNAAWENYRKGIPSTPVVSRAQIEKTIAWLNITAAEKVSVPYEKVVEASFAERAAREILK